MIVFMSTAQCSSFDDAAKVSSELASKMLDHSVVFFWSSEAVEVAGNMTPADVEAAYSKLRHDVSQLRECLALSLVKQRGESDGEFLERGVNVSSALKCLVTLVFDRHERLTVHPWTKFDVALYRMAMKP